MEQKNRSGSSLILLILFYFASNYPRFRHRTSQMQLNPLYYVEFREFYPLRRSAAFKIAEFWPLNKVLYCSEAQKKILKKISSILIIPY